jgi:pectinesterase
VRSAFDITVALVPLIALAIPLAAAGERADFVVSANGDGRFRTIQQVLDSISVGPPHPVVILVRRGVYREKVFIRRSNVTLVGEDRDSTRIVYAELRENWNREHGGSDWGAGVVNIDTGVTDVTIANLTVYNNYGWQYGMFNKHQFAIRGAGTRIILLYCNVISDGGDALSLWDRTDGMYYHANCSFEGWVDYVCPRGWCYTTHSRFFGHNTPSASIWHDGSSDRAQKFVITNSYFDGVPGFPLGRNHLDAQFYLLHCGFSSRMADRPFERPRSSPREWQWGARHYFYDCHREGGDYGWFADNLEKSEGSPQPDEITARWTFDGRWDPEANMAAVLPFAIQLSPGDDVRQVNGRRATLRWAAGRNALSHNVYFGAQKSPEFVGRQTETSFRIANLAPATTYYWRVDEVTSDGVVAGDVWSFKTRDH